MYIFLKLSINFYKSKYKLSKTVESFVQLIQIKIFAEIFDKTLLVTVNCDWCQFLSKKKKKL